MYPLVLRPMAKPMMPCSESGVLKMREPPKESVRLLVHRKTPPKETSSPKIRDLSSVVRIVRRASFTAVK